MSREGTASLRPEGNAPASSMSLQCSPIRIVSALNDMGPGTETDYRGAQHELVEEPPILISEFGTLNLDNFSNRVGVKVPSMSQRAVSVETCTPIWLHFVVLQLRRKSESVTESG
jgi:hypothetical protein